MSTFAVKVRRILAHPHPNADLLALAQVDEYRIVVRSGHQARGRAVRPRGRASRAQVGFTRLPHA